MKRLYGYQGTLNSGAIKDYCKVNNFVFLYKYISQYSSSYWCKNRLELLNRISFLDKKRFTIWNAINWNKGGVITWKGKDELELIETSELYRLNKIIEKNPNNPQYKKRG